jgi:hypothetical protein
VASCSEVLGQGRCQSSAANGSPRWYALVIFEDATLLRARVELRPAGADAPLQERAVAFDPRDTLEERYRAVGLIAAAQVLALSPELAQPAELPPAAAPVAAAAAPTNAATPEAEPRRFGFDTAAFGGTAFDRGPPRLGVMLRPWLHPLYPWLAEASLRFSLRPDDPLAVWLAASLGFGVVLTGEASPVEVRARLALLLQRVSASSRDATSGERDSSAALQLGPELGADVSWPADSAVAVFAGGELSAPRPRLRLELRGVGAGRQPSLLVAAGLGVRIVL